MSKKELEEKIQRVKNQIAELEVIVSVGNMEGIELIIKKIKDDMESNIKEENWKVFKQNKSTIDKIRAFTSYIELQTEIIEDKEEELKDLEYQLSNYQMSLFEEAEAKEATGIFLEDDELFTGDLFQNDEEYLLVSNSKTDPKKFAILTSGSDTEALLGYPKNREVLSEADFLGNLFDDKSLVKHLEVFSESEDEDANA